MTTPEVNVQWKGTRICMDVQCACSADEDAYEYHIDGYIFGQFQCPRCGRRWKLSHQVEVLPLTDWDGPVPVLEGD